LTRIPINEAINKAGQQRMLSQRMAKAYCKAGLGVEAERRESMKSRLHSHY
jgi:hypothetical protein